MRRFSPGAGRYALWREGMIRAAMEAQGWDAEAARLQLEKRARQGMTTREAYRELQGWVRPQMLVDKTPSYALDPAALARAEAEFESPLYLHLLRHPCGMIASFEKAKLEQVFFRHPHDFSSRELAELIWAVCQENIRELLAGVPAERQHAIRFEDLVRSPRQELMRLSSFLGVPFAEGMLDPYADGSRKMTDGIHALSKMVGDVKFHEHRQVDAQAAESWREGYRRRIWASRPARSPELWATSCAGRASPAWCRWRPGLPPISRSCRSSWSIRWAATSSATGSSPASWETSGRSTASSPRAWGTAAKPRRRSRRWP